MQRLFFTLIVLGCLLLVPTMAARADHGCAPYPHHHNTGYYSGTYGYGYYPGYSNPYAGYGHNPYYAGYAPQAYNYGAYNYVGRRSYYGSSYWNYGSPYTNPYSYYRSPAYYSGYAGGWPYFSGTSTYGFGTPAYYGYGYGGPNISLRIGY